MLQPEPFSHWLFRSQLRERDSWWARELDAACERISRQGEAAGPGKTGGTSAIVPWRSARQTGTEHPSEKLTLAQAKALARASLKSYT